MELPRLTVRVLLVCSLASLAAAQCEWKKKKVMLQEGDAIRFFGKNKKGAGTGKVQLCQEGRLKLRNLAEVQTAPDMHSLK